MLNQKFPVRFDLQSMMPCCKSGKLAKEAEDRLDSHLDVIQLVRDVKYLKALTAFKTQATKDEQLEAWVSGENVIDVSVSPQQVPVKIDAHLNYFELKTGKSALASMDKNPGVMVPAAT